MTIEKLVVEEFVVDKDSKELPKGAVFSYFVDDYGNVYRPKAGFTVTGENLMDKFVEIERED